MTGPPALTGPPFLSGRLLGGRLLGGRLLGGRLLGGRLLGGRLVAARLLAALAIALTSLVLFDSAPAHACSCAPGSDEEHAQRAETVFVGTVSKSGAEAPTGAVTFGAVTYEVAVDRVFKGEVDRETTVVTAAHGTACGLPNLPEGKPLIFFASTSTAGLQVNSCDGTGAALPGTVQAVTTTLGEPYEPREPSDLVKGGDSPGSPDSGSPGSGSPGSGSPGSGSSDGGNPDGGADIAPWLAGGAALVAAAVGGGVLLRQRQKSSGHKSSGRGA